MFWGGRGLDAEVVFKDNNVSVGCFVSKVLRARCTITSRRAWPSYLLVLRMEI